MPACDQCGEEIEFRYLDGRSTPIHVNGGWCAGYHPKTRAKPKGWFQSAEAFTDPNALCPVCGASVFYYQNSSGSRVFFDDLGWPWPKHPCTDNQASQTGKIKRRKRKGQKRNTSPGNAASLYVLVKVREREGVLEAKFRNIANHLIVRTLKVAISEMQRQDWTEEDLRDAPSFIFKQLDAHTIVEFISVRKGAIGKLVVPRIVKGR